MSIRSLLTYLDFPLVQYRRLVPEVLAVQDHLAVLAVQQVRQPLAVLSDPAVPAVQLLRQVLAVQLIRWLQLLRLLRLLRESGVLGGPEVPDCLVDLEVR